MAANHTNPRKIITPEIEKFIRDNYEDMSTAQMAKKLGVSQTTAYKWTLKLGFTGRQSKPKQEPKDNAYFSWNCRYWPFN